MTRFLYTAPWPPFCGRARRALSALAIPWALALLLASTALVVAACGDEAEPTPSPEPTTAAPSPLVFQTPTAVAPTVEAVPTPAAQPTAAAQPTPMAPPTPASEGSVVDRLRQNAADFQYAIGKHGGDMTLATVAEPLTFNLAIANDAYSTGVLGYVFEGLTETSWLTDEVEPRLAESWESSDDGLTWTFRLRRDVRWHDGEPFTAHDVDFTFNRIIYNDDVPAADRASFNFRFLNEETGEWEEAPMTVKALDNYTVQCVLPQPFATFLRSMGTAIFPKHILEQYVDDGTFAEVWDIATDPGEIVGTGPYTIESYVVGESVILRRHTDYWLEDDEGNRLPYLEKIVNIVVPDFDAELAAFIAGETDVHGVLGEELERLEPLTERGQLHHPQARAAVRVHPGRIQPEPGGQRGHGRAVPGPGQAGVVPAEGVSPGGRVHHRQGQDHRRGAAGHRVSAVVAGQPVGGRLPQP